MQPKAKVEYLDDHVYKPQLTDGYGLELFKAKIKLTLGKKTSHMIVTVLPTLPVDILIRLDVLSQQPSLKPIYNQLKDTVENFGSENTYKTRGDENGVNRDRGTIEAAEQRRGLMECLLDDGEDKKKPFEIVETNADENCRQKIPLVVNLEAKEIIDGIETTREIEEVLYRVDVMNNYNDSDLNVVREFLDSMVVKVSAKEYKDLTPTNEIEHVIRVTNETPKKQKLRPIPQAMQAEYKKIITDLWDAKFIESSQSQWRHNVRLVVKPDGSLRPAFDFRDINGVTVADAFMLPNIQIIFTRMAKARWHSKFDFCNGYFNIRIAKSSRPYTAIITPYGLFQWVVMAQGLKNSAAPFKD